MKLHRSPALLGRSGTAPKLASLRHGRLFGRFALRCSARFMAQHVKCPSHSNAMRLVDATGACAAATLRCSLGYRYPSGEKGNGYEEVFEQKRWTPVLGADCRLRDLK